jgi:hypothetical protein
MHVLKGGGYLRLVAYGELMEELYEGHIKASLFYDKVAK